MKRFMTAVITAFVATLSSLMITGGVGMIPAPLPPVGKVAPPGLEIGRAYPAEEIEESARRAKEAFEREVAEEKTARNNRSVREILEPVKRRAAWVSWLPWFLVAMWVRLPWQWILAGLCLPSLLVLLGLFYPMDIFLFCMASLAGLWVRGRFFWLFRQSSG